MDLQKERVILAKKSTELRSRKHIPERLSQLIVAIAEEQIAYREKLKIRAPKARATKEQCILGAPMISPADFTWNKRDTEQLFKRLLRFLCTADVPLEDPLRASAQVLDAALKSKELVLHDVLCAVVAGADDIFVAWAKRTPAAPNLLYFLSSSALAPSLEATAEVLAAKRNAEEVWSHGHCPICGSLPFIGHLESKEGLRYHSCSLCKYSYRVPRLQCPFCLEENPQGTVSYTAEEEKGFQLLTCSKCHNYIKLADFRELDSPHAPVLDDLLSLAFDYKARSMGFSRPALSAWGV